MCLARPLIFPARIALAVRNFLTICAVISAVSTIASAQSADLSISTQVSANPVPDGTNLTYTFAVVDNGPNDSSGDTLTTALPSGTTFQSFTTTNGTCTHPAVGSSGTFQCVRSGSLLAAHTWGPITLTVQVNGSAGGTVTDTATVSATTADPVPSNNTATASVTIEAQADLAINIGISPNPVPNDSQLTYTYSVVNNGPDSSDGDSLSTTLPAGTTFSNFTTTNGTCSTPPLGQGGTFTCSRSSTLLAGHSWGPVTLVVNVNTSSTTLTDSASISATTLDSTSSNNSATASVAVTGAGPLGSSNHVWLITLENTSAAIGDPGAQCGVSGQPVCSGFCPAQSSTACTSSNYRRYMFGNTTDMPYLNNTLIPRGTILSQLYANQHGSWEAWMYMMSGAIPASSSNEQCLNEPNIVRSLLAQKKTWLSYNEGMPGPAGDQIDNTTGTSCTDTTEFSGTCGYKRGHNPLINFTDTSESAANGGLPGGSCPESGQEKNSKPMGTFFSDIANSVPTPANFVYITPDLGDDMHGWCNGCSFSLGHGLGHGDGSLGAADAWLQQVAGAILGRPEFASGGDGLLIIMVDEGNTGPGGGNPHTVIEDDTNGGGHIAFVAVGPKVKVGSDITTKYNWSNVEQIICTALGFGGSSCPGAGGSATLPPIFSQ
jgi:uncharacterized repeat protein (TIGR01451 family)